MKNETQMPAVQGDAIPNSGMVKAKKAIPECKVLARLESTSENSVLKTIEHMTGDPTFAQQFVTYMKIQVRQAWRRDESGKVYNLFDKVPIDSVLECLYACARRKVLPDSYNAYIVVYLGKRPRCQLLIDYKGLVNCAIQEGVAVDIDAEMACENDDLEINFGEVTRFNIDPKRPRGKPIGCVAWAILPNGRRKTKFVGMDDLEKIRACAQSDNIWSAWTDEMYKKSAIRRMFKTMRNSPKLNDLCELDNLAFDVDRPAIEEKRSLGNSPIRSITMNPQSVEAEAETATVEAEAEPVFA